MNQRELERAVARATGESRATIRRFGFSCLQPTTHTDENVGLRPSHVDWDDLDSQRISYLPQRPAC